MVGSLGYIVEYSELWGSRYKFSAGCGLPWIYIVEYTEPWGSRYKYSVYRLWVALAISWSKLWVTLDIY